MNISITNDIDEITDYKTGDSVNVLVTGDFCSTKRVAELIRNDQFDKLFNNFRPFIRASDIALTNLESPLTTAEVPISKSGPALKGPKETANALKYVGFKVACLANNHIMDYGEKGLKDTIKTLQSNDINYVGADMSLQEAKKPIIIEKNGYKVAFINIAEKEFSIASDSCAGAAPLDEVDNYYQISKTKKLSDFTILIIHGGHEMYHLPSPNMVKTYRFLADLGVDAIVGHHTHVYSGFEIYHNVPIFYSLGNFLFDSNLVRNKLWFRGFAINLSLNKKGINRIDIIPYIQFENKLGVYILSADDMKDFKNHLDHYNEIILDPVRLQKEFMKFVKDKRPYYISVLHGFNKIIKKMIRHNIGSGLLLKRKKLINKLNLIECQSHREIVVELLKAETKEYS